MSAKTAAERLAHAQTFISRRVTVTLRSAATPAPVVRGTVITVAPTPWSSLSGVMVIDRLDHLGPVAVTLAQIDTVTLGVKP